MKVGLYRATELVKWIGEVFVAAQREGCLPPADDYHTLQQLAIVYERNGSVQDGIRACRAGAAKAAGAKRA